MFGRIANILGWAGVALVLAGVATWLFRDDLVTLRQGFALAGLACILLYAASQWREMAATFARRPARYGALALISVVVVLGLLIGLNYLAEKYNKRWDLTASREFTLSDQTRRVIASLKEPLHLLVFGLAEDMQPFRDRLAEYSYLSNKVKVEYIDLNKDPALARQYQIQSRGTIVVEYQKRVERVTSTSNEQEITNAIIKAVQGLQRKLYFVTGHGEKDPGSSDERTGYNSANAALQRDNYTVETLALAQQAEVPADAAAVVVAGPTRDYLAPEIESLQALLEQGRQGADHARPAGHRRRAAADQPGGARRRVGRRRRQQRRRRPEQHRPGGRPRPRRAGRRHLSRPPGHRPLPLHDALPAGALGDAGHQRPAQRAAAAADERPELGRERRQGAARAPPGVARRERPERPGDARRGRQPARARRAAA